MDAAEKLKEIFMSRHTDITKEGKKEIRGKKPKVDVRSCYLVGVCGCDVDRRGHYADPYWR